MAQQLAGQRVVRRVLVSRIPSLDRGSFSKRGVLVRLRRIFLSVSEDQGGTGGEVDFQRAGGGWISSVLSLSFSSFSKSIDHASAR